jgi:hypothetical protein
MEMGGLEAAEEAVPAAEVIRSFQRKFSNLAIF